MSKRDFGKFERRPRDFYSTPIAAVVPLIPHLERTGVQTFAEPCCGDGALIRHLEPYGLTCVASGDIADDNATDARGWGPKDFNNADACISNLPWEAFTMAAIMEHMSNHVPSWFLIYSDWLFTHQSAQLVAARCTDIVPIGRVKWFPESKSVGFDNCCWVRMTDRKAGNALRAKFWPMAAKS